MEEGALAAPYSRLAGVYDELVVDPCFAQWAAFLESLWIGEPIRRVLDLCCGTGLMTHELAQRGYDLVGVDASPAMLALARRRLPDSVPLIEAELPHLPVVGPFDAAVSTFDGFNYLELGDLAATMAAVASVLRPGGWLVFDVHGASTAAFLRDHPVIEGVDGDRSFTLTNEVSQSGDRCTSTIDLVAADPAESFRETHQQILHSPAQVQRVLTAAGFSSVRCVEEYSDAPATPSTLRATWIARRGS